MLFPYAAAQDSYWAYLLDPPLFHEATWEFGLIKVTINNTAWLGGESSSYFQERTLTCYNYSGIAGSLPICFTVKNDIKGCFSLEETELISESPTPLKYARGDDSTSQRDIWFLKLFLPSKGGFHYSRPSSSHPLPSFLFACQNDEELISVWENIAINGYPKWWSCGFLSKAVYFTPFNPTAQTFKLLDWSVSSPEHDYTMQLKQYRFTMGEASLPTSPANAWFAPGWASPTFPPIFNSHLLPVQPDLYRLFAATHKVILIRPYSEVKRVSSSVFACVAAPFPFFPLKSMAIFPLPGWSWCLSCYLHKLSII